MDPHALYRTLEGTFTADATVRAEAERQLKLAEGQPGYLGTIYQVATAAEVDVNIRQAAAIRLKNKLRAGDDWNAPESTVSEQEKALIKSSMVSAIVNSPSKVRNVLLEAMRFLLRYDYPAKWPTLLPEVLAQLQGNNLPGISGALSVLRVIVRRYEFMSGPDRAPLEALVEPTFPLLIQLFRYVNAQPAIPPEAAELQKLCCKIFWSACDTELPKLLLRDLPQFGAWMECFLAVLAHPVTATDVTSSSGGGRGAAEPSAEALSESLLWKPKKWVGHITQRLLQKYGNPKGNTKAEQKLGAYFMENFAAKFLERWMCLADHHRATQSVSAQALTAAINYMEVALDFPALYALVYGNLDKLLFEVLFPLLCFSKADAELWADNPNEYIRKQMDIYGDMYNPRTAVSALLLKLTNPVKPFQKPDVLPRILVFLNRLLSTPDLQPPVKDGVLLTIGTLRRRLRDKEEYKGMLEDLLVKFVFPDFGNPNGFLRAKAVWVSSKFARIPWKVTDNFRAAVHATVGLMRDPELPVRVQAGSCLRDFVRVKGCAEVVGPLLEPMIGQLFALMAEIDSDSVVETLELIIEKFGENLAAAALQLCHKLSSHFLSKSPNSPVAAPGAEAPEPEYTDEDEEQAMAAAACLRALCTLLQAMHDHKELFPQMEPMLVPLMRALLQPEKEEYLDESLELIAEFTYFADKLSPEVWSVFPLLFSAYNTFGEDYFAQMLGPLDNFISTDPATFATGCGPDGKRYVQMVLEMMQKCLSDEENCYDWGTCPRLLDSLLQNCRDHGAALDPYVPQFFDLIARVLTTRPDVGSSFRTLALNTLACGLFYNAALTVRYLEDRKILSVVFSMWLDMIPRFSRWYDKKITALGFSCLFAEVARSGTSWLPASYFSMERLKLLLAVVVKLVLQCHEDSEKYDKAKEKEKEEESDDDDEESSDDDDDLDTDEEDEDDGEEEGEDDDLAEDEEDDDGKKGAGGFQFDAPDKAKEQLQKLLKEGRTVTFGAGGGDDDDDDDDEDDMDDDQGYEAVIDEIQEAPFFRGVMGEMGTRQPELYAQLLSGLTPETPAKLEAAVAYGEAAARKRQETKEKELQKRAAASAALQQQLQQQQQHR